MIKKHLGDQIDIHGGGMDLIFPHHENEIAQSEGATGKPFVKYWLHNNMINFAGSKMSKSLGNIMPGRDFMDTYNPEIFKYMMLQVHYRSISDLSEDAIQNAIRGLARIYSAMAVAESYAKADTKSDAAFDKICSDAWVKLEVALNDDFNTPEAFAQIFEVVRQYNAQVKRGMKANPAIEGKSKSLLNFILKFGQLAALFKESPKQFLISLDDMLLKGLNLERDKIQKLVDERWQVRLAKDFKKSDELRDQLTKLGISVMDSADGSFWEVSK